MPSPAGTVVGGTIDSAQSQGLSDYLKHHQLPLVSGQVVNSPSGGRQVILLGFVASNYGKTDAEVKAQTYLKDPKLVIDNRIKVAPELAGTKKGGGSESMPSAAGTGIDPYAASGSIQDYQNNMPPDAYQYSQQYQQYQQYNAAQPSMLMSLLPLLGMIGGSYGGTGIYSNYGGFSSGYSPGYGTYGYPTYPPPSPGFGPTPYPYRY